MPTREWSEKIEDKIVDFRNEIPSRMELKESFCTHTKRVESEREFLAYKVLGAEVIM